MASPGFEITPLDWGTLRSRRGTFALWKRNPLFCAVSASAMDGNAIQIWVVLFSILLLGCQTMKPGEEVCVEGEGLGGHSHVDLLWSKNSACFLHQRGHVKEINAGGDRGDDNILCGHETGVLVVGNQNHVFLGGKESAISDVRPGLDGGSGR